MEIIPKNGKNPCTYNNPIVAHTQAPKVIHTLTYTRVCISSNAGNFHGYPKFPFWASEPIPLLYQKAKRLPYQ